MAIVVLVGLTVVTCAHAQVPDLVTDRPDQTESPTVVRRGSFQVETGYLFARDDGVDRFEVPGTLFRIGLGGRTELRVGYAGVVGSEGRRGSGDSAIGAKVNLLQTAAPLLTAAPATPLKPKDYVDRSYKCWYIKT